MALSKVDICNLALGKMGQDITIAAITDNVKPARVFNRLYPIALDLVLAEHSWPFALDALPLEKLLQDPFPGWTYRYAYPSTCVYALAVCTEDGVRAGLRGYAQCGFGDASRLAFPGQSPWQVTYGEQSTSIATDLDDAYLIYVTRVEETARYPVAFADALAARLAYESCGQIMGELGFRAKRSLWDDYDGARARAAAHSLNEATEDMPAVTPSVAARG